MVNETKELAARLVCGSATLGLPVSEFLAKAMLALVEDGQAPYAALPDEGVRLINAFVKIPDRACRAMVIDIVQAIAVEPPSSGGSHEGAAPDRGKGTTEARCTKTMSRR